MPFNFNDFQKFLPQIGGVVVALLAVIGIIVGTVLGTQGEGTSDKPGAVPAPSQPSQPKPSQPIQPKPSQPVQPPKPPAPSPSQPAPSFPVWNPQDGKNYMPIRYGGVTKLKGGSISQNPNVDWRSIVYLVSATSPASLPTFGFKVPHGQVTTCAIYAGTADSESPHQAVINVWVDGKAVKSHTVLRYLPNGQRSGGFSFNVDAANAKEIEVVIEGKDANGRPASPKGVIIHDPSCRM